MEACEAILGTVVRGQFAWKGTERAPEQSVGTWGLLVFTSDPERARELAVSYWEAKGRRPTNLTTKPRPLPAESIIDLAGGNFLA